MDDNLRFIKQKSKYYEIIDFPGIGKDLNPFHSRGGGGVSESTDRRGCTILALEVVPKNLIFT